MRPRFIAICKINRPFSKYWLEKNTLPMIGQTALSRQAGVAKMQKLGKQADRANTNGIIAAVGKNSLHNGVEQSAFDENRQENGEMIDE